MWNECNCRVVEHSLSLSFFGIGMKANFFQSCGHAEFSKFGHIECSTLTASSFKYLNRLLGILSPLALFLVMLPKAHLTWHSRMSDSRWVTTLSCLSRSLRPFLYSSSVYSCYLFLISFASVRSLWFLALYCTHDFTKYSLDISSFIEKVSLILGKLNKCMLNKLLSDCLSV